MHFCTVSILMLLAGEPGETFAHVGSDMCEVPGDQIADRAISDNANEPDDGKRIMPCHDDCEVCTA